jgi:3-phosphoshikimate 1-carboxyvinyltransferase
MRLLAGLMSGQSFGSVLDGSAQLRKRPMRRVAEPLGLMGAKIFDVDGCAPLTIEPYTLTGMDHTMAVPSAQVKSAILLAGLYAQGPVVIHESATTRDHTERMLAAAGVRVEVDRNEDGVTTTARMWPPKEPLKPLDITIPADFSSVAFFLVAAAIHPRSDVALLNVGVNSTRTGLLDALRGMGADIEVNDFHWEAGEPVANLTVGFSELHATTIEGDLTARMIDEFPVFAVAATQAAGTTFVRDAEELRVKESNRLEGLVAELRKMGAKIEATPDGFVIEGPTRLKGAVVDGRGDHRMAMALAVAAMVADGETTITGADCVSKTYPGFFDDLKTLMQAKDSNR